MKGTLVLTIILACIMITACEKEVVLPPGVEIVGSQGKYHFVYADPKYSGEKLMQREIGKAVCTIMNMPLECEVYMWKRREDVVAELPIKRSNTLVGHYVIKDGEVKLKALR